MEPLSCHEQLLNFAVKAGELMLKSGAEIYRVEDTITRLLKASHFESVDTFVIPTGIMVTIEDTSFSMCTKIARVKNRVTRLDRVELINQLSRDYVLGLISFEEASSRLQSIEQAKTYSSLTVNLWIGISCAFFSIMFKGNSIDFFISFCIGLVVGSMHARLMQKEIVNYFVLFICSLFIGVSVICAHFLLGNRMNMESIVIGCIMPLLPGVAFTNAVRDAIGDELLSGISRATEALLIAVSLAAGVGIALSFGFWIGGIL
ncbi:hypothetical protein CS063_07910 [Sporanaerobium hydrogeniformans]|uniref:Uncharacterized protein n=1 Tax=Sporanaerobium hydrogeniformans TaxID=3072179 RepID=A0AC61DCL9_9FIRM|nr:threonine/serine exporter family protein [Sporanaerobium hydrogeniformans]PHV70936.1 hypothetical protein CS063_07910 [Sporanaerobium hydrogeniformans]